MIDTFLNFGLPEAPHTERDLMNTSQILFLWSA